MKGVKLKLLNIIECCVFSKYQNKWYVHWDDERVPFEMGMKKYKMLVRMVTNEPGSEMKEVDLEKGGE